MADPNISDLPDAITPLADGDHFMVRQPAGSAPFTRKIAFLDLQTEIGPTGGGGGGAEQILSCMKADASSADAYARLLIPFGGYDELWLTYDLAFSDAALAFWQDTVHYSGQLATFFDNTPTATQSMNMGAPPDVWEIFGYTSGDSSTPSPLTQRWHHIEFHVNQGGTAHLYVDGVTAISGAMGFGVQFYYLQIGSWDNAAGFNVGADSIAYFANVKVGTTRGGAEVFSDDFLTNDLSAWTTTSGSVSVVANPYFFEPSGSGDVVGPGSATDSDFAQFDTTTGKLIKDGGLSLDIGGLATNSDARVPSQKAVKTYVDAQVFASGGAIPYSKAIGGDIRPIARVDQAGDDGTAIPGDFTKPFLTVAAAITALEGLTPATTGGGVCLDIGANYFSESITTSLTALTIIGTDTVNNGFDSLTFSDTTGPILLYVNNASVFAVVTTLSSNGLFATLVNSTLGDVTNTGTGSININTFGFAGSAEVYSVTNTAGSVSLQGLFYCGTVSAVSGATAIFIDNCMPTQVNLTTGDNILEINSAGSDCKIQQSLVKITAANDVALYDSRIFGVNGASGSTTSTDYYLS